MDPKHYRFMKLAKFYAKEFSKDRSTQVGAVIIGKGNETLSTGYNGFIRGVNDHNEQRHERPEKYDWSECAERNAIYNAARIGVSVMGARIYVCSLKPCRDCARAIIQSGITDVYVEDFENATNPEEKERHLRWQQSNQKAMEMLKEAGVKVHVVKEANTEMTEKKKTKVNKNKKIK